MKADPRRDSINRQLEELQLIQCSLLPDEQLRFIDSSAGWGEALETYTTDLDAIPQIDCAASFSIRLDGSKTWFEITLSDTEGNTVDEGMRPQASVAVKGEDMSRSQQDKWNSLIAEKMEEISDSDFPMYQLISLYLLPLLREEHERRSSSGALGTSLPNTARGGSEVGPYHVLFTSHHLISPNKRRSLQQWSSSLSLTGFAKVGYPGVIYAQGDRPNIEEFVDNVKAMQWLALKVRFVEPLQQREGKSTAVTLGDGTDGQPRWKEFQKVGKVVEEMRRIGREEPRRAQTILRARRMSTSLGFRVSRGVLTTIAPPIPRAYEWGSRYKSTEKLPLLDMSQGVPGIPPPESVQSALGKAASSPVSFGYTRWDGEIGLRKALVGEMKVVYGAESDINVDDVALTSGCNLAFVATAMSVADAGDEIILPVPWYIQFLFSTPFIHLIVVFRRMTLTLLGIKTVALKTYPEDGFTPSVERCRDLITPKTKAIVLVTPNNPTGATYSPALISDFAALAAERRVALIVDETYRDFIVTGSSPHNIFLKTASHPWRSTFVHLFSFSKAYCLPGHRLGAIAASPVLLGSIKSILDTLQICAPRPIQLALAPLLPELRSFITDTAQQLHVRHQLFKSRLPPKWRVGAQGGYYAYVRHPFVYVKAGDVSRRLAEQIGVVTLPSTFFSQERRDDEEQDQEKERTDEDWKNVEAKTKVEEEERWIRFSVANVDDEKVQKVSLAQSMKNKEQNPRDSSLSFDPVAMMMYKITGKGLPPKPRLKTAANIWRKTQREAIENNAHITKAQVKKHMAALRDKVARQLFTKLDKDVREHWRQIAIKEYGEAFATWTQMVESRVYPAKGGRGGMMSDRQRWGGGIKYDAWLPGQCVPPLSSHNPISIPRDARGLII
ncbi:hypothetical protein CVT25_004498 [Psilocybe cyanescens]|uniref:Uncharacterized protein n=1 Tax=Psilocybe cyanescens TaxID=93625 RepID=A0A409XRV6_PSICY|nr:hypothetical protein CVT25_004498 [Psilocybe cyanescens]